MLQFLAATALAVSTLAASTESGKWQDDYGQALAATRTAQRPLLVVLDDPSTPQTSLQADLLASDGDSAALLQPFNVCHVDVTTEYGRRVAKAFRATSFPHTAIIDKTGAIVLHKQPGQMSSAQWKEMLEKYQSGERSAAVAQTVYYRGGSVSDGLSATSLQSPAYCPSCQRKAMGMNF